MITSVQTLVGYLLRLCHICGRGLMTLSCILFSLLVLLVVFGSILRYVVGTPLAIADETASLLFLSGSVLTLTYGYLDKKLIRISLFWDKLSDRWQKAADVVGTLAGAAVFGTIFWSTLLFAWDNYTFGTQTVMTNMPVWPWAMSIPVSLGLMSVSMVLSALDQLLDLLNPKHNLMTEKR